MRIARVRLALSCLGIPAWSAGEPEPDPNAVVDPALLEGLEYEAELQPRLDRLAALFEEDLTAFNQALAAAGAGKLRRPPLSDPKSRSLRHRARWA